jgi:hypothetical protein
VDVAALFGARKPALAPSTGTEDITPAETTKPEPEGSNGKGNDAANLAAEAAADDEPDFPPDTEDEPWQQEETEFDRLTGTLEEYMSFKEYLDVTTSNGINPYKLAENELNSKTATEESRRKMVNRLRDYLISKHVKGVA